MTRSAALSSLEALVAEAEASLSIERQIERFLSGDSDGGPLLNTLYGDVLDEPVPERLLTVLRERCR